MKLDVKAMGLFAIQKVAELYNQWVKIEDLDGLGGCSRWAWVLTVHASYLAPFDEPYNEP